MTTGEVPGGEIIGTGVALGLILGKFKGIVGVVAVGGGTLMLGSIGGGTFVLGKEMAGGGKVRLGKFMFSAISRGVTGS